MAHSLGLTRDEFRSLRARHPDFDAGIMRALFEYEARLLDEADLGDESQRAFATKELARRFPQRHGVDPRLRTDRDERIQDDSQDSGNASEPVAFEAAVEALLEAKKAGRL